MKELLVTLSIEYQHGDPVRIIWRAHDPKKILRNDVPEQCRLAGTSRSKDNRLHYPRRIGPEPRLAVDVISEHDGVLRVGRRDRLSVFCLADKQRRMRPVFLPPTV